MYICNKHSIIGTVTQQDNVNHEAKLREFICSTILSFDRDPGHHRLSQSAQFKHDISEGYLTQKEGDAIVCFQIERKSRFRAILATLEPK